VALRAAGRRRFAGTDDAEFGLVSFTARKSSHEVPRTSSIAKIIDNFFITFSFSA